MTREYVRNSVLSERLDDNDDFYTLCMFFIHLRSCIYFNKNVGLVWFYGTSTIVGY